MPSALATGVHATGPHMKGTAFKSTLAALEKLHGAQALTAVKASLDAAARDALEQVLSVSWYPVSLSAALHEAIRDVVGRGDWEASRAIGREAARIDYTGVYRVVLRSIQYDSIFARLEMAWRNYYTHGVFSWTRVGPASTHVTVKDARGFNAGMWIACAGRTEELLTLTGARTVDVTVREPNDTGCEFDVMWID